MSRRPVSQHLAQLRANVLELPPAPEAMQPYLEKVREGAYAVTDADVDALRAAGLTEDEIFEQTVGVAVGEGLRRLEAAARVLG